MSWVEDRPSGSNYVEETSTSDLAKNSAWIGGKTVGQLSPALPIEWTAGLEIVGTIKDASYHVPFCEPEGVIADGIEHATVGLSFSTGPGRAGRSVAELRRTRGV
jgi:hypothetical protein